MDQIRNETGSRYPWQPLASVDLSPRYSQHKAERGRLPFAAVDLADSSSPGILVGAPGVGIVLIDGRRCTDY